MARICSIFRIKGRVGNTIFSERDGKQYARSVPASVKNPNSEKQQAVRNRFRVAVRFYQRLKDTPLEEVWRCSGKCVKLTGFALFMRENLNMFDPQGMIVDYDGFRLAIGNRDNAHNLSASVDTGGRVTLRWVGADEGICFDQDDRLIVVLLYGDRAFSPVVLEDVQATRGEGVAMFNLDIERNTPVHVYCFFVAPSFSGCSDSQHLVV